MVKKQWVVKCDRNEGFESHGFNVSHDYFIRVVNFECNGNDVKVTIKRNTLEECYSELRGQITDGFFENVRVLDITEVL